ncbi:hypothetical protein ACJIZ3_024278 [Penstemon smallii]|uniref:Uncharacterized protein n=1 Tax=Penstemon smallii TaxID=265156 RepID=A0ABD3TRD1_9LAMI
MNLSFLILTDNIEEVINYLPGVESLSTMDLMPYLKESGLSTIEHKVVIKAFDEVKKADFILHNTLYELESKTLSALTKIQPNYAIGPINFSRHITNTVTKSLRSESDCTNWLNSKPPGSVLYVSFGSFIQTSKHVIEEIAYGLLLSEIGVNLCDGKSIDRKEVAENIGSLMSGVNSEGLRKEPKKVQGILHNAMEVGGSFEKNFNQFVEDLKDKL